ncbi:hypothetical protein [Marivita geojedonensis]|uniref:AAA+ family ATPase n=1 Tax=Marivita geojedonensis TaxID=1123756 RepID=A0A1X4NN89_9RHOB|nr:hypothetical protein [Marivita geojedonensis]OSQ51994.1 hypothetical protein MGEO_05510 [Marivita geojedonensis]PRY81256.1 hypothetical protein CLV76_102218 [Marivita geojedonensis]
MKQISAYALAAALLATGASAEENGTSLMEEGAKLFFRGLMEEMEPALRELEGLAEDIEPALRSFAEEMGPALRELMAQVEDWSAYEPPVVLPNGDILLKRKQDAPPLDDLPPPEDGEIDI